MKKTIFTLVTLVLVSLGTLEATNTNIKNQYNNGYGNSFTFVESGITFSVFQNGEFDFYLNQRNGTNVSYQSNNINISFNAGYNYDAYVQYDRYGAVIQIENVPVYYDYYGRVTQVGNININYNNGRLVRLGGMHVYYNSYGAYAYNSGYINHYNRYYVYHPYHNYFVQPYYDYRVVSYKPYRAHYKEQRYAHSHKNSNYYKNQGNKGHNNAYKSNGRVKTTSIPNKRSETVVNNSRRTVQEQQNNTNKRSEPIVNNVKRNVQNQPNNSTYKRNETVVSNGRNMVKAQSNERQPSTVTKRATTSNQTRSNAQVVRKPVKSNENSRTADASNRDFQKKEMRSEPIVKRN